MGPNLPSSSPLLNLPAELREQIYMHAFACQEQHAYCIFERLLLTLVDGYIYRPYGHTPHNQGNALKCGSRSLNLLQTCRLIHNEASPVFHSALEVRLHIDGRYRSPTEIKGQNFGPVEALTFLRGARKWEITVRLNMIEDADRLIAQLESLRVMLAGSRGIEWRSISVQLSKYADEPAEGLRVLDAVRAMTGVRQLDEIDDPWREGTTVFDYQAKTTEVRG